MATVPKDNLRVLHHFIMISLMTKPQSGGTIVGIRYMDILNKINESEIIKLYLVALRILEGDVDTKGVYYRRYGTMPG